MTLKNNVQLERFDLLPESELKARIKDFKARREANAKAREAEVGADTTPLPGIGHYMALNQVPASTKAIELAETLAIQVQHHHRRKRKPTAESVQAAGAIIADLLQAIPPNVGYAYRSTGSDSFLGSPVGRSPFKTTIEAMVALGYVERRKGFMYLGGGEGADEKCASRFIPTPAFIAMAHGHGLDASGWSEHFKDAPRPVSIPNPIGLKTASKRKVGKRGLEKITGVPMALDRTSALYLEKKSEIDYLNRFLSEQTIEGCSFYALHRIYSNGDKGGESLTQGGRMYNIGGGYQNNKSKKREEIRINGERATEVDVSCCQPSIASALANIPLDPSLDAYALSAFPRIVIKLFAGQTMGSQGLPRNWTEKSKIKYGEWFVWEHRGQHGPPELHRLERDCPFDEACKAAIKCLPVLDGWKHRPHKWGTLQNVESDIMTAAMLRLAKDHGIPALPVFDSLIVPISAAAITKEVIAACFFDRLGVYPRIK